MTRDELREKVIALLKDMPDTYTELADNLIALVLEEAARECEAIGPEWVGETVGGSIYNTDKSDEIAAAIRALGKPIERENQP